MNNAFFILFWQTSSSVVPRPSQPYLPFKKNMKVNSAFIMKKLVFYPIYNYWPPSRYLPPKHKLCNHLDCVQVFAPHFKNPIRMAILSQFLFFFKCFPKIILSSWPNLRLQSKVNQNYKKNNVKCMKRIVWTLK